MDTHFYRWLDPHDTLWGVGGNLEESLRSMSCGKQRKPRQEMRVGESLPIAGSLGAPPTLESDHDVGEDAEIPINRCFNVLLCDPIVLTL